MQRTPSTATTRAEATRHDGAHATTEAARGKRVSTTSVKQIALTFITFYVRASPDDLSAVLVAVVVVMELRNINRIRAMNKIARATATFTAYYIFTRYIFIFCAMIESSAGPAAAAPAPAAHAKI